VKIKIVLNLYKHDIYVKVKIVLNLYKHDIYVQVEIENYDSFYEICML
jgi:hypothetical protein